MIGVGLAAGVVVVIAALVLDLAGVTQKRAEEIILIPFGLIYFGGTLALALAGPVSYVRATIANGMRPQENARRQNAHEAAVTAALRTAEPLKAAADHRLRAQVRELEALAKTVREKEVEVRKLLADT